MDTPLEGWTEGVRSAMSAPPLSRSEKSRPGADPKWAIGDALLAVPEAHRDRVADDAGLDKAIARSYWRTAEAWPASTRTVSASWTVHRELAALPHRFEVISAGMTIRDAQEVRTGKRPDRRAQHNLDDDDVIDEVVRLMLSPRSKDIVPQILDRLNASKEGRRAAHDRRSGAALRRLAEEIRLVQKELKRLRGEKSPALRFMESRRRLLDTEVNVEEIGLLFNDPDERQAADEEEWLKLAGRLRELQEVAAKVANDIVRTLDVVEAEAWDEADAWSVAELSDQGDDIVDAEIVDED